METQTRHDVAGLIALFDATFAAAEGTRLVRGEKEPVYLPADDARPCAEIVFAHGFFASALHEIAHWCVAGKERRKLLDFGYWYKPDGRTPEEQARFEQVEVKPQALEWIFSRAAAKEFHFSADNLAGGGASSAEGWTRFTASVAAQARAYVERGLPRRARMVAEMLERAYGGEWRDPASYVILSEAKDLR